MMSEQKVAVITGAASGIGLALAQSCLQDGMHIIMADNAVIALYEQVERLKLKARSDVLGIVCDITQPEALEHLVCETQERFNRIDWLFNNAGVSGPLAPVWELTTEQIRNVLDINLHGTIYGLQAFLPWMFKQTHRSHVINMASVYGLCSGSQMAAYAMSKQAIVALSESLYFDLQRLGKPVDVSVICPSFVNTSLLKNSAPLQDNKLHHMMTNLVARSRPPEDVAEHIVSEVKNKTFYILPDKEVKHYCEQRTQAIVEQTEPHKHSLEKIIASLSKRAMT